MSNRLFLPALASCLLLPAAVQAENRFYFDDVTVGPGATGQRIILKADNDVDMLAFSFAFTYDPSVLENLQVSKTNTLAEAADFYDGRVDAARGLVGYGCVLDWDDPLTDLIPAGTDHSVARVTFDAAGDASGSTQLILGDVAIDPPPNPPVRCVITKSDGQTVKPDLTPGTVSFADIAPVIVSVLDNSGVAGDVFTVVGDNLDQPGLSVTVCDQDADATLDADGRTLHVTAPACASFGFAVLEVCTTRGCDSLTNGFEYQDLRPVIVSVAGNRGVAGDEFTVAGDHFDEPDLAVTVCGQDAAATLEADGRTLRITAPACGSTGFAPVEVCNTWGCDSRADGFDYEDRTPIIVSLADNSGEAGDVFEIVGDYFDEPDLAVTVCDLPADASLEADGRTLQVTAPDCGVAGFAIVEVCTTWGCDQESQGFDYVDKTPIIESLADNAGSAGDQFEIVGDYFDEPDLVVTVCDAAASAELQSDGRTLLVTAPACDRDGFVPVDVCTRWGCDSEPEGFEFTVLEVTFVRGNANRDSTVDISDGIATLNFLFLGTFQTTCLDALDANDTGDVDLSDAVFIFNYLFMAGDPIPAPYPEAGTDPTPDALTPCQ